MKKLSLILFLSIFVTPNAHATVQGAHKFSDSLFTQIFSISAQEKDINEVRKEIIQTVKSNIDINYISKFVLGKHWRITNAFERKEFASIYEQYLILTYAPKFQGYNNETFEIGSTEEIAPAKYITTLSIISEGNTPISLEIFLIETQPDNYKIVDISGEGISFAATQRSEFSSLISSKGVKKFILQLNDKVQKMNDKVINLENNN